MTHRSSGILPDMAGIYSIFLFLVLVRFSGQRMLGDGDTLWHIRAGATMLDRGELLTHDIFSHTAYGQPWIAHEWLAEVVMGLLHKFGGLSAVTIFYFFLIALTFWLLIRIAQRLSGPGIALFCVSVALVLSMTHMLSRPHIFTWFFGLITFYILLRTDKTIYLLPPITALWANFHGGVLLGLALQGIFFTGSILDQPEGFAGNYRKIFREHRRPLAVLAMSLIALGANPFGYQLLAFQFQVTGDIFISQIGEWRSPNLQNLWYYRYYLLTTLLILALPNTRTDWVDRILLIFFINISLIHQRHISLAVIFLTPFWSKTLKSYCRLRSQRYVQRDPDRELVLSSRSGPLIMTLLAFCLLVYSGTATGQRHLAPYFPLPATYSTGAINFLKKTPPTGKMLNDYEWGDYLIYAFGTKEKVFIDGRADMYGEAIFKDYLEIKDLGPETENLLNTYQIDWIIFPIAHPLTLYLEKCGAWTETYRDEQVAILIRNSPPS